MPQSQSPEERLSEPPADLGWSPESSPVPRWVQILAGLLLFPFSLLCLAGSVSIFGIPKVQSDPLLQLLAAAICLLSLWAVILSFRMLFGLKGKHGLMGPMALRIVAVSAVGLVIGSLFSGVWVEHPIRTPLLCLSYVLCAIRLWQVANHRSRRVA
jgi:hypothetical protein